MGTLVDIIDPCEIAAVRASPVLLPAEILAAKSAKPVILAPSIVVPCGPGTLASITGGTGVMWIVIRRSNLNAE